MGTFTAILAVLRGLPRVVWAIVAALLVVLAVWVLAQHDGAAKERAREAAQLERANDLAEARDRQAVNAASVERLNDQSAINSEQDAERDAVAQIPDARPSQREFALACERLRRQPDGRDAAAAARCGPGG